MKRARGQTLSEVLIGAAIFSIVVTVSTDMLAKAMQTTRTGEDRGTALDQGTTALYRISDDVRDTRAVVEPNYARLAQGANYVVLQTQNDTVAYRTASDPGQAQQQVLERFLYETGYPNRQNIMPGSARYLTSAPTVVQFGAGPVLESNTIEIVLVITPANAMPISLETKKTPWVDVFAGL